MMFKLRYSVLAILFLCGLSYPMLQANTQRQNTLFDPNEFDQAISPCTDLNTFANGKWIRNTPIPDDKSRWDNFTILSLAALKSQHNLIEQLAHKTTRTSIEQQIYDFYRSGMNQSSIDQEGYHPIQPTLHQIDQLTTPHSIVEFIQHKFSQAQFYLFGLYANADYQNANMQMAYIHQDGLGLPTPEYYISAEHKEIRHAYLEYIAKLFTLTGMPLDKAKKQAAQVLAFETSLAKASLSPNELRDPKNQYRLTTIDKANQLTPHFNWTSFFTQQGLNVDNGFSLAQPTFFKEIDRLLINAPLSQWQAYLHFHTINSVAGFLSAPFEQAQFDFYGNTLKGQKNQAPRWERVLNELNEQMGMALGELYVKKHFSPQAKQKTLALIDQLRAALKTRLENNDWMSAATKEKALEKLAYFLPKVGYPDTWRSWKGLVISPNHYAQNIMASQRFNYQYMLSKIGKPTDRHEWHMTPQMVNAYYNPTDNTINFPAAILQAPFFDIKADDALNYGGIGAVIGHEMTHGYDDQGSKFNAQGNQIDWWTPQERKEFEKRTKPLVQQFDHYFPLPGLHVDGKLTVGENIADLAGLSLAYEALQLAQKDKPVQVIDGYTQNQRLFLSWALVWRSKIRPELVKVKLKNDPHAPAQYRINGPVSNLPEFAKTFSCPQGSAMVRPESRRVKIW